MIDKRGTRPKDLLEQAQSALDAGNHDLAVELMQKSAEGYLIRNESWKARKIFTQAFSHLAAQGLFEKIFFTTRNVIRDFERDEAFEEGGELLRIVADYAQKNQAMRTAAEFYSTAGEFFQKAGGENAPQVAATCFARAAEAYGLERKTDKAERHFVRAVMNALRIDQELLEVAEKGWRALAKARYDAASEHFRSVSNAFRRGVPELQKLLSDEMEYGPLSANATARLYHISATFAFLTALCLFKIGRMGRSEEEFEIVRSAALGAIEITMPVVKNKIADSEDKWRTSVDLLLLLIADYFAGVPWEHAFLIDEMKPYDEENQTIHQIAKSIARGKISRSFTYLESAELGILDEVKPLIMETLRHKKEIS
jgi:hypothetical protein